VYKELLDSFTEARANVDRIFYGDHIYCSIFRVRVSDLKAQCIKRLDELSVILFASIKNSITVTTQEMGAEVDRILDVINSQPSNIEEVVEVQNFVKNLQENMSGVQSHISSII